MGTDVNHLGDGSTVIDIDRPPSVAGSQQIAIDVPDDGSTLPMPLASQAAGSLTTVVDQVHGETLSADVSVAVKSPAGSTPQAARRQYDMTLNAAVEV